MTDGQLNLICVILISIVAIWAVVRLHHKPIDAREYSVIKHVNAPGFTYAQAFRLHEYEIKMGVLDLKVKQVASDMGMKLLADGRLKVEEIPSAWGPNFPDKEYRVTFNFYQADK